MAYPYDATPAASGGDSLGWKFPNYDSLLSQWFSPYQDQYNAQQQAGLAQLNTSGQIAQNRFNVGDTSTLARLKQAHETNMRNITNTLAARGILRSGEKPFQEGQENLGYKQAKYDASNQLLDFLSGLQQQYAQSQQQALGGLQQTRSDLASQIAQIYQPYYQQPDPTTAPYGYDSEGNPVDLSAVTQI